MEHVVRRSSTASTDGKKQQLMFTQNEEETVRQTLEKT